MRSSLEEIKNKHLGESLVIFTCGPSFSEYPQDVMLDFCAGKRVFTVKQSFHRYKEITDYHFFNDNNFSKYETSAKTIASAGNTSLARKLIWGTQKIDYEFSVVNATGNVEDSLSYKKSFEYMLLESQEQRIWGPGIMYETVLPFAIHLGFKNIYVNGWDYTTKPDGTLDHYYDEEKAKLVLKNTGSKIGQMDYREKQVFLESTDYLYDFLKDREIQLSLISRCSEISSKFERVKI